MTEDRQVDGGQGTSADRHRENAKAHLREAQLTGNTAGTRATMAVVEMLFAIDDRLAALEVEGKADAR